MSSGGWTPPASLRSWHAEHDPDGPQYASDAAVSQYVAQLMGSSPGAFAALEEQLISTSHLAGITAQGLTDAKAADWHGEAADQYRQTLAKLPQSLHQVSESYSTALSALSTFATTSLSLKAQYGTFQEQLAVLKQRYNGALDVRYPDETTGWAVIHGIQNQLNALCTHGIGILQKSVNAWYELHGQISPLTSNAPHESDLTKAMAPIRWIEDAAKDLWHGITGTWGAINAFADNPNWSTLGDMTEDLSIDASVVVLAAAAPEALAGLGLIDAGADSSLLAASAATRAAATGVGIGSDGMNVASSVGEGKYATAAISAALLGTGIRSDLGGDELDEALDNASVLDSYDSLLQTGMQPRSALVKLGPEDAATLKELVPDYHDPAAVAKAAKAADEELSQGRKVAGLVDNPKDFAKDHFLTDPTSKAVSQWLDSSTGQGGGSSGSGG